MPSVTAMAAACSLAKRITMESASVWQCATQAQAAAKRVRGSAAAALRIRASAS
jgi:hypothetical protein